MKYIATRERVEKIEGSGPATQKQKQLIEQLLRDFPDAKDLFEYEDYLAAPTVAGASAFITMALDVKANEAQDRGGYMKYIGTRPRVERSGEHGLFSSAASVSMDAALHEVESHEGNVWTLIYSLRRGDAARLGYDNAASWRKLLMGKQAEIAAALKIQPDRLRWYAAFHDEGEHPHVHVMVWSTDPKEGFLTLDGLLKIQSKLTNEIFRGELEELYARKDVSYKELTAAAREAMSVLVRQMDRVMVDSPSLEQKLSALARTLETVKGKKVYGYLKKPVKAQVDEIVDALAELPEVAACYEAWNRLKDELDGYYHDQPQREHLPLSQQKEFRAIKNMVIREADNLRLDAMTFEDAGAERMERDDAPEDAAGDMPWVVAELDEPDTADDSVIADSEWDTASSGVPRGGSRRAVWRQAQEYREAKAILYDKEASPEEKAGAVETLERLWREGFTVAAHQLGKTHRDGLVAPPDLQAAEEWFRRSAEADNDCSQFALGKLLQGQDRLTEAVPWLERAAENGNQYAQYRIAKLLLADDTAVPQDVPRAIEYLTASATRGNQWAQYLLGKLYLQGREVERDVDAAVDWLTRSTEQGNAYAKYLLDHIGEQRDPSVMLAVTRLLHHMSQVIRETPPPSNPAGVRIDSKRRRKLMAKRLALGHKIDDHEDELNNKYQHHAM